MGRPHVGTHGIGTKRFDRPVVVGELTLAYEEVATTRGQLNVYRTH